MSDIPATKLDDVSEQGQEEQARNNQIHIKYTGDNTVLNKGIASFNTEEISCDTKSQEGDETPKEPKISLEPEATLSGSEITESVESEIRSSDVAVETMGVPPEIETIVGTDDTSEKVLSPAIEMAIGTDNNPGSVSLPAVEMTAGADNLQGTASAKITITTATESEKVLSEVGGLPGGSATVCTDIQDESMPSEAIPNEADIVSTLSTVLSNTDIQDESMPSEAIPNEADIVSTLSTVLSNAERKSDQQITENQSKDNYRTMEDSSESDDSDSDDSDSSSVLSVSSSSEADKVHGNNGDSDADCDDSQLPAANQKKGSYPVIKVKGELQPEDLPPLEELHITVPSSLCAEIGVVASIVNTLVVIQAHKGLPALDLDSVLFVDNGSRSLGLVFDVLGPVNEPMYCVRFNSAKHIEEFQVKPGDKVYFAPSTGHSKYVFLQQLLRMKGSDASWRNDIEPTVQIDFSDDEEERNAKKGSNASVKNEEEQQKRKREQMEDSKGQAREQADNKKKQMLQQRNAHWKEKKQMPQQGGGGRTGQVTPRPHYQPSQYSNHGHIRPPSFTLPDFSTPPPSTPQNSSMYDRGNTCYNYPPPATQSSYGPHPYRNPVQPANSFGQLPYGPSQDQVDPRLVQFGAQFAQMVCALQASTTPAVSVPPPPPPSFTLPYNTSAFPGGSQSNANSFNNPPPQNQAPYSLSPFNAPPPMSPSGPPPNLPPTNIPPPPGTSNYPSNHNPPYGLAYSLPHSSSYQGRR